MLSKYRKLVYADDRYNDNILSFAYLCRSFLRISRHKSPDSTPCNWNTWRYWLFCCYNRQSRVNSLCRIMECLLFFRISTEPHKSLLDHHIFGYTHHWSHRQSIVVRLHAEPLQGSGNCCSRWTHLIMMMMIR